MSADDFLDEIQSDPPPSPKVIRMVGVQAPVAIQPTSHAVLGYLAVIVASVAITAIAMAYLLGGRTEARPASTLTAVAAEYMRTLPAAYHEVGLKVRSGNVKTLEQYRTALKDHAKSLADAQDAAAKAKSDDKGVITNPDGLADDLEAVAIGLAKGVK